MSPEPTSSVTPSPLTMRRIRIAAIAVGVLAVGVIAWAVVGAMKEDASGERWDRLRAVRDHYEPRMDPFAEDPGGIYRRQREAYVKQLEKFLESDAKAEGPALEAHVRWLIAKASADILLSMQDVSDFAARVPHYDRALAQLKILQTDDRFTGFPPNWSTLKPEGESSWIKMFASRLEANRAFDEKNLPKDRAPATDTVVLVRTELGDVRFGLFGDDAPEAVAAFLKKARAGRFDGTAVYEKIDEGSVEAPEMHALRAGDPATRDAKPYDAKAAEAFGKAEPYERLAPGDSRWRVPATRGVVAAWHRAPGQGRKTEYDETGEFLLVVHRSPKMDYAYTALGKATDEASLATIDRLWDGKVWQDDKALRERTGGERAAATFLQAPVKIVKVLVYKDGALLEPEGTPAPEKVAADETERSLSGVKADQYRKERPAPPAPPAPPAAPAAPAPEKPADGKPADEKPSGS